MNPPCKVGNRIRLIDMPNDPCPISKGDMGTVVSVSPVSFKHADANSWQIAMRWDNGRRLSMVTPTDTFEVVK